MSAGVAQVHVRSSTGFHSRTIIDPPASPAGRTRCVHDMLDGECAIHLGHNIEDAEFGE